MWRNTMKNMMNSAHPRGMFAIAMLRNTKRPMERLSKIYTKQEAKKTMHKVQKPMQKLKHK